MRLLEWFVTRAQLVLLAAVGLIALSVAASRAFAADFARRLSISRQNGAPQAHEKTNMIQNAATMDFPPEASPVRPIRILLAEDEAINRLFVSTVLGARGFQLTAVANGAEALRAVRESEFDLVLMDVGMPQLDGRDAAARIRRFERETNRRRTPILALTGYSAGSDVDDFFAAGMDDLVSKPIDELVLFAKIAEWANRRV